MLWQAFGSEFSTTIRRPVVFLAQLSANKGEEKDESKSEDKLRFMTGDSVKRQAWILSFRRPDIEDAYTNFPHCYWGA